MTLATTKKSAKSAPLPAPTIRKERAKQLTDEIFELGDKIGQHLAEIRDSRGFQHLGYRDFVTYCKTEFGYGKSRAYQLIQEAQIEKTLREESIISESERLTSSHYTTLANDVAPEDRGKVLSYAKRLAEMRGKNLTAIDIKAAAVSVKGDIPNRRSKWAKPLSRLGLEKGSQVVVNPGLPTSATGVIKKVREDGRVDVYLYGFNTIISYSFSDVQLAEPMSHIPLTKEECDLNQEVRIFSSRMKFAGEIGIILSRLKEMAIVDVGGKQYELCYEELAAIEEGEEAEEDEEKNPPEASEMTVEVKSEAVDEERDDFNWTNWTRKWLPRMLDWLSVNATDRQRLDIFSALAEKLSAEGREAAIAIFGGELQAELDKARSDRDELENDIKLLREEFERAQSQIQKIEESISDRLNQCQSPQEPSISERVLTPFRKVKIQGLLAKEPLRTEEIVQALGDSCYSEVMETLTSLVEEGIVLRQGNRWQLIEVEKVETSIFEIGDRVEVVQPEGWCEIAYANIGQTGIVQGKAKRDGWDILLDEAPAKGKRKDITLSGIRLKKLEPTTSINQVNDEENKLPISIGSLVAHKHYPDNPIGKITKYFDGGRVWVESDDAGKSLLLKNLVLVSHSKSQVVEAETTESAQELAQQITEQRQKLAQNKSQLEQNLKNLEKEKEPKTDTKKKGPSKADRRKKMEKDLMHLEQRIQHIDLFEAYAVGDTVQNNGQNGTIKKLDFSLGGMPQAWVEWEGSGIVKAESVSTISQPQNIQPQRTNIHDISSDKWAQVEEFQKQLIPYVAKSGVKNPYAYANTICKNILNGESSPLFDDFLAGRPLGSQVKRDWETEPGINYPAFEEERIQYHIHRGEPVEQATLKARDELRNPTTAQALWDGFLRKIDRIADDAIKAKELGVETPYLPPSFTDKPEITKESVGAKLEEVTSTVTQGIIEPSEEEPPTFNQLKDSWVKGNTASKSFIENSIKNHPEWGYKIEDLFEDSQPLPFQVGDYIQDENADWIPLKEGKVKILEILNDSNQLKVSCYGEKIRYSHMEIYPSLKKALGLEEQ
ncbi:hypothetical protein PN499_26670 [Kamptonema animale CS-326]|jgi:hypothetical protein|uniref:hypothetical protein n=1 Tax=Kamptonema animale TaxID=92934 RepID=UPI0023309DD3|nr:hypothetical protein [Kamptonema animale]MDB9514792.1 hypothetical protein [Kamptonema animale CS-326]